MSHKQDGTTLIAVMGETGAGKSSFINTVLGYDAAVVNSDIYSCTRDVAEFPYNLDDGRRVILIDAPGFNDYCEDPDDRREDGEILEMIANFLKAQYDENRKFSGIVFLHNISRRGEAVGAASRRNMEMFKRLCGNEKMSNVVVVTTCWDEVCYDDALLEEAEEFEQSLMYSDGLLKELSEAGVPFLRSGHFNEDVPQPPEEQYQSPREVIQRLLSLEPVYLKIQEDLAEGKTLQETDAGLVLQQEFDNLKHDLNERMDGIQKTVETLREATDMGKGEWEKTNADLQQRVKEWERLRNEFSAQWKSWETSQKSLVNKELENLKLKQAQELDDLRSELRKVQDQSTNQGGSLAMLNLELKRELEACKKERSELLIDCQALRVRERQLLDDLNDARTALTRKTVELHTDKVNLLEELNSTKAALAQKTAELEIVKREKGGGDILALRSHLEEMARDRDRVKALQFQSEVALDRMRLELAESKAELEKLRAGSKGTSPRPLPDAPGTSKDPLRSLHKSSSGDPSSPRTPLSPPPPYNRDPDEELAVLRARVATLSLDIDPNERDLGQLGATDAGREFLFLLNERIPALEKLSRDRRGKNLRPGVPQAAAWPGF